MKQVRRELFNEINITPLTDIFLVLLIIMMVVAPMLEYHGLDMTLTVSGPSEAKQDNEAKRIWVAIAADGTYQIDDNPVAFDDLVSVIRKGIAEKPEGLVIEADPDAQHAALAHAIDAAQSAGIAAVSVVEKGEAVKPSPEKEKKEAAPKKPKKPSTKKPAHKDPA